MLYSFKTNLRVNLPLVISHCYVCYIIYMYMYSRWCLCSEWQKFLVDASYFLSPLKGRCLLICCRPRNAKNAKQKLRWFKFSKCLLSLVLSENGCERWVVFTFKRVEIWSLVLTFVYKFPLFMLQTLKKKEKWLESLKK